MRKAAWQMLGWLLGLFVAFIILLVVLDIILKVAGSKYGG